MVAKPLILRGLRCRRLLELTAVSGGLLEAGHLRLDRAGQGQVRRATLGQVIASRIAFEELHAE